ncbi:MAG: hypothetical protein LBS04_06725 [Tannerellaceae bacterium]|jgi:hypothetical protein|nr:hypothetical protein [Tannerellaceae bacterium]
MKKRYYILIMLVAFFIVGISSYVTWNTLYPNYTCALCHEIKPVCSKWEQSVHAEVVCIDCHGKALESVQSAKEKLNMIYTHFTKKKTFEDIYLSEKQSLAIANRCAECHQAELVAWKSGAHSASYKDIFMDVEHNKMERPYWDCFRCHGMFYDGDIDVLMTMVGDVDKWKIKETKQMNKPTISCLACHQSHHEQPRNIPYEKMDENTRATLAEKAKYPATALYMRADRRHMPSADLQKITLFEQDSLRQIIDDPNTLLCMQCHAPNTARQIGSEDDKTPTGVYEGMNCITCHDPHSNMLKTSYRNVHK